MNISSRRAVLAVLLLITILFTQHTPTSAAVCRALSFRPAPGLDAGSEPVSVATADFDASGKNPLRKLLWLTWFTNLVLLNLDRTDYIDSSAIGWLSVCWLWG